MKLFNRTMQDAVSVGLTSIHDAGLDPMSLEFFKRQAFMQRLLSGTFLTLLQASRQRKPTCMTCSQSGVISTLSNSTVANLRDAIL
jgi:hypothetical protein